MFLANRSGSPRMQPSTTVHPPLVVFVDKAYTGRILSRTVIEGLPISCYTPFSSTAAHPLTPPHPRNVFGDSVLRSQYYHSSRHDKLAVNDLNGGQTLFQTALFPLSVFLR